MSEAAFEFGALVSVGSTNRNPLIVIDGPRRMNDLDGGFRRKRGQTNRRFLERGSLIFWFPTRERREKYIALVEEAGDPAVVVERRKRLAKSPRR